MVLYGVTRIAAPFGFLTPLQDYRDPGSGFALSRDGSVGIILRRKGTIDPDWRCLVIARNGRRRLLPRPPSSLLAVSLTKNPDTDPPSYLSYDELAFADDGTLFLTTRLATGMHGLWTAGIVSWNGSVWRNPVPSKPIPGYTGNDVELVAATSSERFVATEDFNDSVLNLDRFSDPHYEEVKSLIVDGRNFVSLGYGFATAMKGGFVVGYSYGARDREYPDGTIRPSTALMWQDGWRTTLGPGVGRRRARRCRRRRRCDNGDRPRPTDALAPRTRHPVERRLRQCDGDLGRRHDRRNDRERGVRGERVRPDGLTAPLGRTSRRPFLARRWGVRHRGKRKNPRRRQPKKRTEAATDPRSPLPEAARWFGPWNAPRYALDRSPDFR